MSGNLISVSLGPVNFHFHGSAMFQSTAPQAGQKQVGILVSWNFLTPSLPQEHGTVPHPPLLSESLSKKTKPT